MEAASLNYAFKELSLEWKERQGSKEEYGIQERRLFVCFLGENK